MKCKYWDCGWCYAPENVETNATQGGCFEPEYCPYTKQMTNPNKTIKDSDQYSKITFNYPIDDEIVMINGVKYQKVEESKTEPSDTEILEFLLNQFQAHSLKMNGESDWVFMNTGFPMSRAKGKSARDAVITAMEAK